MCSIEIGALVLRNVIIDNLENSNSCTMDDNDSQCMYSDNLQVRHAVACNNTHKNVMQGHHRIPANQYT